MIRSVTNANAYRIVDSTTHPLLAGGDATESAQAQGQKNGDSVSISDEAIQALEEDRSQALVEARVDKDPSFAAEMAKSLAYRSDSVVMPKPGRSNGAGTYDARNLPVLSMSGEAMRMKRIALYEAEMQKGTPPAEIYHKLTQLSARMADLE